ncbi:MAG: hypothetical protein ACD_21C00090G0009 [uncultured bacterium]|nr:MAG: hypothetical protein ACD_21C00090G0009 [uncultured bacterium]
MLDMIILASSIIAELIVAIVIVTLVRTTGKRWAWVMIFMSIILMAIRHAALFSAIYTGKEFWGFVGFNEVLGFLPPIILLVGILGIVPVISSRKRLYKDLLDGKTLNESVLETTIDGVLVVDSEARVLLSNKRFSEMWNIPSDVLVSKDDNKYKEYALRNLEDSAAFLKRVGSIYANQEQKSSDEIHFKDGRVFERYSSPLLGEDRKYRGRVWFFRDITKQKELFNEVLSGKILSESIVNTAVAGILVVDSKGKVILFNKRFVEIWKIPQAVLDSNDASKYAKHSVKNLKNPRKFLQEVQDLYINPNKKSRDEIEFKDGKVLDRYSSPLLDANGKYRGRVWFFRDITEKKEGEAEAKYRIGFEQLVGKIAIDFAETEVSDIHNKIQDAISKLGEFVGFDRSYVILINPGEKIKKCILEWKKEGVGSVFQWPQKASLDFFQEVDKAFKHAQVLYVKDVNELNDDWTKEKEQWAKGNIRSSMCIALNVKGKYLGYICFECMAPNKHYHESDVNLFKTIGEIIAVALERKRIEEELEMLAKFDTLTTLPNRYQFGVITNQMLAYSIRHGLVLAVLSMDLDNFKNVNDTYGHAVGDMLLKEVGARCKANIRAEDFIARMGGDEFVIVAFGLKEALEADVIAKKIIEVVQQEYKIDGFSINTTASIGIACYPMDGKDQQTLLKNADIAMYNAKASGRNKHQFFTKELQMKRQGQLDLESEMQVALSKKEFFLVYQPQFDENKKVIGMEALLRWHHPVKGLLLPGSYIVIAENSGLIVPLGKWVLEEASKQYNEWKELGVVEKIRMSINLSFRQIEEQSIATSKEFFELIKNGKGESNNFELELTETALMRHPEVSREILNSLHNGGFGIAIDDFGTGYSSLQYLKYLPVQRIKIDQSFIAGIGTKTEDEIIIETSMILARKLGFAIIAEGVETEAQFEFLKKHGCKQFQGYYFSYPLESADMLALLKKNAGVL